MILKRHGLFQKKKITKILNPIIFNNWNYFEKDFIKTSISGKSNPISFEKKVCKIFEKLNFNSIHTGQKSRLAGGGYSDVIAITKNNKNCIIADAKAIKNYTISSSDKSVMIDSYVANYRELVASSTKLESIVYVCGSYGSKSGLINKCEDIYKATGKKTSVIDSINLLKLIKKYSNIPNQLFVRKVLNSGGIIKLL